MESKGCTRHNLLMSLSQAHIFSNQYGELKKATVSHQLFSIVLNSGMQRKHPWKQEELVKDDATPRTSSSSIQESLEFAKACFMA